MSLPIRQDPPDGLSLKTSARDEDLSGELTTSLLISRDRCRCQALLLRFGYPCKIDGPRTCKPTLRFVLRDDGNARSRIIAFDCTIKGQPAAAVTPQEMAAGALTRVHTKAIENHIRCTDIATIKPKLSSKLLGCL